MKTRSLTLLVVTVALAAASIPAFAQGQAAKSNETQQARLEQRVAQLEARLRGKTGARERQELQRQQREIDELMRRLAAGESVSPEEIDELLGQIPLR